MTQDPFKVGQAIDVLVDGKPSAATILCHWHDRKNDRHRLTVRDDEGRVHLVWSDQLNPAGSQAWGSSVDLAEAEAIARRHLQREHIGLGIEAQMNTLACAVLQLRGRP
jgi:hypothetical protein